MHLIALANHMGKTFEAPSTKNDAPFPGDWRKRADGVLTNPNLESLEGELLLDNLAQDLRRRWLQRAHARSDAYIMSPPHKQIKLLPGDERISYPYDRWVRPEALEKRLKERRSAPDGWVSDAFVFANGMCAITTFFQMFRAFAHDMWDLPKGPLSLHLFGGYFEITKSLTVLCDQTFQGRKHATQAGLCKSVALGKTDLIVIEPVTADIDLNVFDMDAFSKAFRERPKGRSCVILLDTSLSGDVFPLERFCHDLGDNPPNLVVNIRSGLKLDQQGLELSNLGLMTLWAPDNPPHKEQMIRAAKSLRVLRITFGLSLSQDECAALSAPFVLDKMSLTNHGQSVFDNNQRLALELHKNIAPNASFIGEVIHPCLSPDKDKPWAKAPFVNLRYRSDDHSDRALLRAILEYEAQQRKISFVSGSSFGFRAHRFEMGFVRGVKFDTLRLSMGSRAGPSLDAIIVLLIELAAFKDFDALRKAYPVITAMAPKDRTAEEA